MKGRKELCGEGEEMTERRDRTGTSERLWRGSGLFVERGEKARRDDRHDRGLGVSRVKE